MKVEIFQVWSLPGVEFKDYRRIIPDPQSSLSDLSAGHSRTEKADPYFRLPVESCQHVNQAMYNLGFVTTNLNLFRREGQILDRAGHGGEQTLISAHATYLKEASGVSSGIYAACGKS